MLLSDILNLLEGQLITQNKLEELQEIDIHSACGSDLMSDVLAFVKDQSLLLTGLVNPQVIRTAEMMDIRAVCFVRGKVPDEITMKLAMSKDIPLFTTSLPMYVACGKLYSRGLGVKE